MNKNILIPPKLYLDTSHLICISKIRAGKPVDARFQAAYEFLDDCISNRYFGLIFNPFSPIEWIEGNATQESANEIADVIDSSKHKYQLEQDTFIYTSEILSECRSRNSSIHAPKLPILHEMLPGGIITPALSILAHKIPGYFNSDDLPSYVTRQEDMPSDIPVESAKKYVAEAIRYARQNPEKCRERIDGYIDALNRDIQNADLFQISPEKFLLDWMKRFLRLDKILLALNTGIDVDQELKSVDIAQCPAVHLWFQAREKRMRAGHSPKENDVDDWVFLPVVPYADLILTERQLKSFILQADPSLNTKVVSDPNDAVNILKRWI